MLPWHNFDVKRKYGNVLYGTYKSCDNFFFFFPWKVYVYWIFIRTACNSVMWVRHLSEKKCRHLKPTHICSNNRSFLFCWAAFFYTSELAASDISFFFFFLCWSCYFYGWIPKETKILSPFSIVHFIRTT